MYFFSLVEVSLEILLQQLDNNIFMANELSVSVSLMFNEGRKQRHSNILPEIVILYENAKCSEILFTIL